MDQEDNSFIKSIQQQWTCSISKMLIKDPVVTSDGYSYERQAITQWFETKNRSPLTGLELNSTVVYPNIAFRNLIDKLTAELPGFLAKEEGLKTYIGQLKEEIEYLKVQLSHEKEKNDEYLEREEDEFKTKKIEKKRHEDKNLQLKVIRDQKNAFQKQLQLLRTKQQQQNRRIRFLEGELSDYMEKYTKSSKEKKEFQSASKELYFNRATMMKKIKFTFGNNLLFIGHLLQSIEDAKKYEIEKGTRETIDVKGLDEQRIPEQNENPANQDNQQNPPVNASNQQSNDVISHLEKFVRERINGTRREAEQEETPEIRRQRLLMRRQQFIERHNLEEQNNRITASLERVQSYNRINFHVMAVNNRRQLQMLAQQPHPNRPIRNIFNVEPENHQEQDSDMFKQLQSIKWLMSKRNYCNLPQFYDYQFIKENLDPKVVWFGVRIRVLESKIPFAEYLDYDWNHVRILDLSASNIDDQLWQRFVQKADNFKQLCLINLYRNNVKTVTQADLEKFYHLKEVSFNRNRLTATSINELRQYSEKNPLVKVEYRYNDGDQENQAEML